jgi:hypothetical protein
MELPQNLQLINIGTKPIHFEKCSPPIGFTHHKAQGKGYHELNMHRSWGIRGWGFLWEMKSGVDVTTPMIIKKGVTTYYPTFIPYSLFSWLYSFPMYATNNYPIFPSNNFFFFFSWLYHFPLSATNNYPTFHSNNFHFFIFFYIHFFYLLQTTI